MNATIEAAELLITARQNRHRLSGFPDRCRPQNIEAAYAIQNALLEKLIAGQAVQPIGYKIGCTNERAQQLLGIDGPFYGRLLSNAAYFSPVRLAASDFFMLVIEPEFAFKLGGDLPPIGVPYNMDSIAGAIEAVLPAIEIVDSRFSEWTRVGVLSIVADNGSTGAWIQGSLHWDWKTLDLHNHEVTLQVNGETRSQGCGAAVMGHPLNALVWLANTLCDQGSWLRAGDLISTGVCCDVYLAASGDSMCADFGKLGTVELSF